MEMLGIAKADCGTAVWEYFHDNTSARGLVRNSGHSCRDFFSARISGAEAVRVGVVSDMSHKVYTDYF